MLKINNSIFGSVGNVHVCCRSFFVSLFWIFSLAFGANISGQTIVDNLGNGTFGDGFVPPDTGGWAQAISVGYDTLVLSSITVRLKPTASQSQTATVELWSSTASGTVPVTLVESLGLVSLPNTASPVYGDYTVQSELHPVLYPGTRYWVAVKGGFNALNPIFWAVTSDAGSSGVGTIDPVRASDNQGAPLLWSAAVHRGGRIG